MAYGTFNSKIVSVTNFGAKGDGLSDDTNAFQRTIDSVLSQGGGTVFVPKGNYLTSGYLNITGGNMAFQGEDGTSLLTAPDGEFRKINISGVNPLACITGIFIRDLIVNGGRASRTDVGQDGIVNVYNATDVKINDCVFSSTPQTCITVRANSAGVNIRNNLFQQFYIGVHCHSLDISGYAPKNITVNKNRFVGSWCPQDYNFAGAVKFSNNGFEYAVNNVGTVPAKSNGHIISENYMLNPSQMGVELWAYISDSIVSNNYIEGATFGTSIAASSNNISIVGNNYQGNKSYGIELALAKSVTINGNVINGKTGASPNGLNGAAYTSLGIAVQNSDDVTINGNLLQSIAQSMFEIIGTDSNVLVSSNILYNDVDGGVVGFDVKTVSGRYIKLINNVVNWQATGGSQFFFNQTDGWCSGVHVAGNDMIGYVNGWAFSFYNPGSYRVQDILVEDNKTNGLIYCAYGTITDASSPLQAVYRNNYTNTSGIYSIPDATYPAGSVHYGDLNVQDAFQYYGSNTYTFTGAINSTSGGWLRLAYFDDGGVHSARFRVTDNIVPPSYNFDGTRENLEFRVDAVPYGFGGSTIVVSPRGSPNGTNGVIQQIVINNSGGLSIQEVWVNVRSGSNAISGYGLNFYCSESPNINSLNLQYEQPSFNGNNTRLDLSKTSQSLQKVTYGYGINTGVSIYSSDGAALTIETSGFVGIPALNFSTTSISATVGGRSLPATAAGFVTMNITGKPFKIPYYNL